MITSPPLPPSPPEGPPRGTNFSRRKATQPLPPSPALTRIVASSMNMASAITGQPSERPACVAGRASCSKFASTHMEHTTCESVHLSISTKRLSGRAALFLTRSALPSREQIRLPSARDPQSTSAPKGQAHASTPTIQAPVRPPASGRFVRRVSCFSI